MKRELAVWEDIFSNDSSDKGLSPKYIKNSYNSILGRQTVQVKNGQGTQINTSPRRLYRWPIEK